jgi:hypothetical protein
MSEPEERSAQCVAAAVEQLEDSAKCSPPIAPSSVRVMFILFDC